MTKPDYEMICQVMLYGQGFRMSNELAKKIVPFFNLCDQQLSKQSHYDFTLRAMKAVLTSAGNIKRSMLIEKRAAAKAADGDAYDEAAVSASDALLSNSAKLSSPLPRLDRVWQRRLLASTRSRLLFSPCVARRVPLGPTWLACASLLNFVWRTRVFTLEIAACSSRRVLSGWRPACPCSRPPCLPVVRWRWRAGPVSGVPARVWLAAALRASADHSWWIAVPDARGTHSRCEQASVDEQEVMIKSISQNMVPKLVGGDNVLLVSLLQDVFPNAKVSLNPTPGLREKIEEVCLERHYVAGDKFIEKVLQLYLVTEIQHGLMLVGPSGTGKSAAWNVLLEALRRFEGKDAHAYVIDPKAISKAELFGFLDPTTREWTDGIFTSIVRKVIDNKLGELEKRQWIIFDGDVDPEWVENLNSVLDDNALFTLPNGERLVLPTCMKLIFEVQDLDYATQVREASTCPQRAPRVEFSGTTFSCAFSWFCAGLPSG
jgi:hypothetical protein